MTISVYDTISNDEQFRRVVDSHVSYETVNSM